MRAALASLENAPATFPLRRRRNVSSLNPTPFLRLRRRRRRRRRTTHKKSLQEAAEEKKGESLDDDNGEISFWAKSRRMWEGEEVEEDEAHTERETARRKLASKM